MNKILTLLDTINETIRYLQSRRYQTFEDVVTICWRQMAQARILELYQMGEDKDTIADGTGLSEKTIRFWLNGKQSSTLGNYIELERYCMEVKLNRAKG